MPGLWPDKRIEWTSSSPSFAWDCATSMIVSKLAIVDITARIPPVAEQLSLDDASGPGWTEADDVVEEIRSRFGGDAIGPATLAKPGGGLDRMERGQQQWGPNDL